MIEYLRDKEKQIILEQYILDNLKDVILGTGFMPTDKVVGIDILKYVSGNNTNLVITFQARDGGYGRINCVIKINTNDDLFYTDDSLHDELNNILTSFNRNYKLEKII